MIVAFRAAFGEVICYDNLDMAEDTQKAFQQLEAIFNHIGCDDCGQGHPCSEIIPAVNVYHFADMIKPVMQVGFFHDRFIFCKNKKTHRITTKKMTNTKIF